MFDNHSVNARFHAPDAKAGAVVALDDEEARHLTRVLRLDVGATVAVFDGHGAEFDAVVERIGRHDVALRVGEARSAATEARVAVTLVQAVLKGEKMDDVVRDAVMVGVAAIQPVVTARTEISLAALQRARRRERWERVAIASAKQSGRAVVPPILDPIELTGALALTPSPRLMLVEPRASVKVAGLGSLNTAAPAAATVLIGPEGGWTSNEIAAAEPSCTLITIGGRTLRAGAMATVAIAALFARWGEY